MYNDTLKIPYKVVSDNDRNGVVIEIDYKKGKYSILVEKEGFKEGHLSFEVVGKRNSIYSLNMLYLDKKRSKTRN